MNLSHEESDLHQFLTNFQVTALGQGDPIIGVNLLATMACTLSDLAPDDGTVVYPDGTPVRLGTSLLVTGAASAGRVGDEVLTEVGRRNKNLAAHLRNHLEWIDETQQKHGAMTPPDGPGPNAAEHRFADTQQNGSAPTSQTPQQAWSKAQG